MTTIALIAQELPAGRRLTILDLSSSEQIDVLNGVVLGGLDRVKAPFGSLTIAAFDSTSTDVDCPGVQPTQSLVATPEFGLPAALQARAVCRDPDLIRVYLYNASNVSVTLSDVINVWVQPL